MVQKARVPVVLRHCNTDVACVDYISIDSTVLKFERMSWGYFDGGAWVETYEMRHHLQIEDAEFEMVKDGEAEH